MTLKQNKYPDFGSGDKLGHKYSMNIPRGILIFSEYSMNISVLFTTYSNYSLNI